MAGEVIWFCFYLGIIEKGNGFIKSTMFLKMICDYHLQFGNWINVGKLCCAFLFLSFLPV